MAKTNMAETKENKVVRGWSLSEENIRWLNARAFALSTVERKISGSQFLDNLIAAKRDEHERAARIMKTLAQ